MGERPFPEGHEREPRLRPGHGGNQQPRPRVRSQAAASAPSDPGPQDRAAEEPTAAQVAEEKPAKKRRCSASWARMIAKVYQADPLTCRKCDGELQIIAYLTDGISNKRILDHLGLNPPENEARPPPIREVVRVPVDEERWEVEAP